MTAEHTSSSSTAASQAAAQVELLLARIDQLPTLPAVATRLLELTLDDRSYAAEVTRVIESDPSLSARILALLRRSDIGVRANTVERAVVLLGFDVVRNMVLSMQIFDTFSKRLEEAEGHLDWHGLWKHCLAVGCAARLLAAHSATESTGNAPISPEAVFACGLLHDLGKLVLGACFPKSYDRVIARVEHVRGDITEIEREVFGIDHTLAGKRLAARWKLPMMIQESIWLHHHTPAVTPAQITNPLPVKLIQLADRLVRSMRIGYSGNYAEASYSTASAAALGLSTEALKKIENTLPEWIEERSAFVGLERLTSKEIYLESLAEVNAELARINEHLTQANRRLEDRSRCFNSLRLLSDLISPETTHEDVAQASCQGLQTVVGSCAAAVIGCSQVRGAIGILAARPKADGEPSVEIWPAFSIAAMAEVASPQPGWREVVGLPGDLLDHLRALLTEPARWWYPLRHHGRFIGAMLMGGGRIPPADDSFSALADGIAAWLNVAEARAAAERLNEELAQINRRLATSQAELARTYSLAMVGDMAAGAAHELNNPLAVISGRAQLINRPDLPEEVRRTATLIQENAHKASAIVEELMEFAKPATPKSTAIDPVELFTQIRRDWIENTSLLEQQFRLELSDGLPKIRADAAQIRMLFDEVIRNSVEAVANVKEPLLIVNCQADRADEKIVISIQDNGCGMSPEVAEQAMTPFYSYRPAGRARGLGLSRAARYAQINGGRIRLSSALNGGTTAFVELPTAG
ncbi:MAG: HDOD domain-containing protein [Phycisphaerales bacterium]|nr:HDOD domain-containing protein [Phycisphaerales bacterium]